MNSTTKIIVIVLVVIAIIALLYFFLAPSLQVQAVSVPSSVTATVQYPEIYASQYSSLAYYGNQVVEVTYFTIQNGLAYIGLSLPNGSTVGLVDNASQYAKLVGLTTPFLAKVVLV